MSIHINAKRNDIARRVILSGDPLRMKYMAYKYLTDVKEVSNVRNESYYTGVYKGKRITFGSHGMGAHSAGTYATELIVEYGVDLIIRCGSASSYKPEINVLDTAIITRAYSDNLAISRLTNNELSHIYYPNKLVVDSLVDSANRLGKKYSLLSVHSADVFYSNRSILDTISETQSDIVDAESFAIFAVAKKFDKKAAAVLQISDNLPKMEYSDSITREQKFTDIFEIALDMIAQDNFL
ncbi:purine nucleoside phosphorylase DeoD-type [Mycoplasma sp. U97]|uniref:phosphorylase family protein n=1 Tax=Mycoplasma tauri TaxID=547987 RepID=UPI001CC11C30|nr:purine nucleoside phosphorylase DeoD-type [Mycoplasma tauri]MBZ4212774.1 purine nucleoside phosphorylase DeoD-type [Mycoplasma tauri]